MKMDSMFGAKINHVQLHNGVVPHVIIPKPSMDLEKRDSLLSSLPISSGHLIMADKHLSFLLALLSIKQKEAITKHPDIKHVGAVNVDVNTLSLLIKDGMRILSNPNITKDIS